MCLVLIAYKVHPGYPLVIAANRDEYYLRPASPAGFWEDHPQILGGRDLQHGGTWLAVDRRGRVAVVTNYREPSELKLNLRSRGLLVTDFLFSHATAQDYLHAVAARVREYDGFNLFAGDAESLYFYGSYRSRPLPLQPGVHGISNGDLDYPWPKVTRGKQALQALVADSASLDPESLFTLLLDRYVPADAGLLAANMGLPLDRILAPIFVTSAEYGTRSSTVVLINADGAAYFAERSFDNAGVQRGAVDYTFRID